jgi:hypothetical protein
MASYYTLSSYSLAAIAVTVAASNATPTYIWQAAIPAGAKGKAAILQFFFNLYNSGNFAAGQIFNYGIYVDGTPLSLGDSTTIQYTQTAATPYAISSAGVLSGTNGFYSFNPIIVPVSFSSGSQLIQIGITNASTSLASIASISLSASSNVTVASGTLNTTNYIPINTFTTPGSFTYTVPTTVQGGPVIGVYLYVWGAGGQTNGTYVSGGAGGFSSGFYACTGGTVLGGIVGNGGAIYQPPANLVSYGGGGCGQGSSTMGGGGFSGVFSSTSITTTTAILMGGGGAGAGVNGSTDAFHGGGGGGLSGGVGWRNGGPIADGYWGFSNTSNIATQTSGYLQFMGIGAINQVFSAGGGGWWGGIMTNGGSGYIAGLTSGATTETGTTCKVLSTAPTSILPGGSNNTYYVSGYGNGSGTGGLVVIVPAVGTSANQIGVGANIFTV